MHVVSNLFSSHISYSIQHLLTDIFDFSVGRLFSLSLKIYCAQKLLRTQELMWIIILTLKLPNNYSEQYILWDQANFQISLKIIYFWINISCENPEHKSKIILSSFLWRKNKNKIPKYCFWYYFVISELVSTEMPLTIVSANNYQIFL